MEDAELGELLRGYRDVSASVKEIAARLQQMGRDYQKLGAALTTGMPNAVVNDGNIRVGEGPGDRTVPVPVVELSCLRSQIEALHEARREQQEYAERLSAEGYGHLLSSL